MDAIKGLHHVTAIASDPQRNVDFYRNVLGQRLVKRTVNFDAPDTYHFYFADEIGNPGSVLTFFAWPDMRRGVRGNGETNAVAYNVPLGSLKFWQDYLQRNSITPQPVEKRFGENVLAFEDPDGMHVELVETYNLPEINFWQEGPIPQEYALRGFHSVTLFLEEVQSTADLLTDQMGFRALAQEENRHRFVADSSALGHFIDLVEGPEKARARFGVGSIHHIAFRTPNDEQQLHYQTRIRHAAFNVTEVLDRSYFHSIYFREHGGVLFEIATDAPGFTTDEPVTALGESLKLPEWFEPNRTAIEESLHPLELKSIEKVG
jgi:glyoxalase family protein